ncbi:hypothetical protein CC80DRAFT_502152 [Byssothecium circinans]|uniref:Uncharacterized protein n=1 Tax=Byssothecium circinans TaxID=147558 RepID=A0A6A5U337_9PLEO|nr:hypothetical protein CC80DRAFT_502152 [Byssothecium circinans]
MAAPYMLRNGPFGGVKAMFGSVSGGRCAACRCPRKHDTTPVRHAAKHPGRGVVVGIRTISTARRHSIRVRSRIEGGGSACVDPSGGLPYGVRFYSITQRRASFTRSISGSTFHGRMFRIFTRGEEGIGIAPTTEAATRRVLLCCTSWHTEDFPTSIKSRWFHAYLIHGPWNIDNQSVPASGNSKTIMKKHMLFATREAVM